MATRAGAKASFQASNLEALGAFRLAQLVLALCEGNPAARRVVRLALAEQKGPAEMAREVRKRLASVAHAGALLDGRQRDALLRELERHISAIRGPIAAHDPAVAVDLLWDVLELAEGLIDRCDGSDGVVRDWFHPISAALGEMATTAGVCRQTLADRVYAAVVNNAYGQFDPVVRDLAPALGAEGLDHLRLRLEELRGRAGGDERAGTHRRLLVRIAMLDIADALGDAEAYLAEYRNHDPEALTVPVIAAQVADRLTAAGRAADALTLLQRADPDLRQRRVGAEEWCDARLAALEALGRGEDAQAQRWEFALMELSRRHLRDYLARLPAFEDGTAEDRALDLVAEHEDPQEALWFLLHWPEPHRAARLVLSAPQPLNGDVYQLLAPLAELLETPHPLAATRCLRAMIDFTLGVGRVKRYVHAARHLATCHRLAGAIDDWGALADHRSYLAGLRQRHGRKYGFWSEVSEEILAQPADQAGSAAARHGADASGPMATARPRDGALQPDLW